ncbi:nicotinamide N-methyltransferase-like [Gastrophryne carolinensis]
MECSSVKHYHIGDFHSRSLIDTYCCTDSVFSNEVLTFPMEKLHQVFDKDHVRGDLCIDISFGSFIHHVISASDCFKKILLMRITDNCIFELNRWLHDRTGAFCWNHTSSFVVEKQGTSDLCEHIEMQLKNKIRHVIKCNLGKENITDPVETPQGDCVITFWLLESISNNHNDYVRNLRKILECLKPGGRLILIGDIDTTYYMNNGERFYVLKCDKEFICSAILGEKLIIDQCEVCLRTVESDLSDFGGLIFISAHREI